MSSSNPSLLTTPLDPDTAGISHAVRCYAGLVYATARRIVGDAALAEDVMQSAFAVLARKFHRINPRVLPGWLVNTTRLTARNALRGRRTQLKHEARAAAERAEAIDPPATGGEPTVDELLPLLDDALARLNEIDRTAVVLRFLQGQSFAQVASQIGGTEDAARKRVARAVEKLRTIFMQQGLIPSIGGIAITLASQHAPKAPAFIIEAATKAIQGCAKPTGSVLARVAPKILSSKAAGIALVSSMAIAAATVHQMSAGDTVAPPAAAASQPATAPAAQPFNAVARLADGTTVELFGVNLNPDDGKPGWRADGGTLDAAAFTDVPNHMSEKFPAGNYEFGLRFTGADRQRRRWSALNLLWRANGGALGLAARTKNKRPVPDEYVLLGHFDPAADQTDITIRFAPLPAVAVARMKADIPNAKVIGEFKGIGRIELSNPREVDGMAALTALTPPIPDDWQFVVRAVPRAKGFIVPFPGSPTVGGTNAKEDVLTYRASLADVAEFSAEVRDYSTRVEFHNISLQPGVHTDFHIVTHDPPRPPQNAPPPNPPTGGEQGL